MINNVVITGAGKISFSLSAALKKAGFNINCVLSRSLSSARMLAGKTGAASYTDSYSELPSGQILYVLAVPDGQIRNAAEELARCELDFASSVFIHLSGAQDISLLESLKEKGAMTGSMHIMQSFPSRDIYDIKGSYAAVEAPDEKTAEFLMETAQSLELKPFIIASEGKGFYHLSGVFACNFFAANFFGAEQTFRESGIEDKSVFSVMKPIVGSTLNNIEKQGTVKAISGPVDRGDYPTVKKHLDLMLSAEKQDPAGKILRLNYLSNSLMLLEIVKRKYGRLESGHLKIRELLIEQLKEIAGDINL